MEYREEISCLLQLVMAFGAGSPRIWEVLRLYETPECACEALKNPRAQEQLRLPDHTWRRLQQTHSSQVEDVLERCAKNQISLLWYGDPAYPEQLLSVVNPPVLLFYQGNVSLLQESLLLTVVGTRNPTEYSLRVEKAICHDLAVENFILVTGFAVGVDITANLCALAVHKPSIALMGCGLDVAYPTPNVSLKPKIAENGLLLSEFLPGTEPKPSNFPLRNRVLSGLTMGTLVIQAPLRSGALITAECAMEQGRDVFCVPPADIFDKRYMGVIKYLRDGAIPVFESGDIVYEYYTGYAYRIAASALYDERSEKSQSMVMDFGKTLSEEKPKRTRKFTKKEEDLEKSSERTESETIASAGAETDALQSELFFSEDAEMQDAANEILALLQKRMVMHIDQIAAETQLSMDVLISVLTELELCCKVQRTPGKQFSII